MKKLFGLLLCVLLLSASVTPALACRHHRRAYRTASYRSSYSRRSYPRRTYYAYPARRSFWQKHRDALTLAIGAGGGAGVGALLGGRRGAGIGTLVGLGSSALYTYKLRDRHRGY